MMTTQPPDHYIVTTAHVASDPDPIELAPGDRLRLGRRDDEYPGWIRVTTPSGNEGWAPETMIRIESSEEGVALANYTARELDTRPGERLSCAHELLGWLWVTNEHGQTGWVPKKTVRPA